MAIQSSYTTVAEQVINFNNNVVSLLSNINTLVTSSEPAITVNITDQSGIARQFTLPSFGFLKSEIDRLIRQTANKEQSRDESDLSKRELQELIDTALDEGDYDEVRRLSVFLKEGSEIYLKEVERINESKIRRRK